jgi:hypothetical protein
MRNSNSSALRSSVSSVLAVAVISAIAWSFDSYTSYLFQRANGTPASVHAATPGASDSLSG